ILGLSGMCELVFLVIGLRYYLFFSIHIEESQCELIFQDKVQFRIDELEKQKAKFNKRNKEN
ncbi:TPA: hypothetical protein ACHVH6_002288, partial [Streptococcus suis]